MKILTINPATEEILREFDEHSDSEIEGILNGTSLRFKQWKQTSFKVRSDLMMNLAKTIREKKTELPRLMALEMGKPINQGISEAEKCAWVCEFYAENAEKFLSDEIIQTELKLSQISYLPLGTVLGIMPWNFPFWQVFRFAAPSISAGNTCLLKHSRNTSGCAVEIENLFKEAGFPENVFNTLLIGSSRVNKIIEDQRVSAVTLTGSTPVGKDVASKAGSVIKKTVMELGGSDPYIILEDADLKKAAEVCAFARLINSGQSCISAKRFIVIDKVKEEFEKLFVEAMANYVMGDPLNEQTQVGPQARRDLQLDLHRQVNQSLEKGAKLLLGGFIPDGKGYYYPPTVLTDVKPGMAAFDEETFGPVAAIISAETLDEAIEFANMTEFGLGAAVFTENLEKGLNIARNFLEAGNCFVNTFVRSDPRLPFGGIKESGYGRELSIFGIREFVNIKTVCIG